MIFGKTIFGHNLKSVYNSTVATHAMIADQESARAFIFHATPYDPSTSAEVDVYASIGLKKPLLDDGNHYPCILRTAVDSQVDLFGEDEDAQGRTSFGNLELLIGGGDHDALIGYFWDGRDIEVKLGAEGDSEASYLTVLKGTAEDITYTANPDRLAIVFRGKEELLTKQVQENVYAGTGGLEGDEELAGNLKPLVFGDVTNITPVLVDQDNQIYQFHDGPAQSVQNAFDGGFRLTSAGDVADIEATTVEPGYYKTQLSGGYIRLGAVPEKLLTMDVRGDASDTGYVRNSANIVKRIAIDYTDLTEEDLDLPSFYAARLDSSRSSSGIYISNETAADAITQLMYAIGGAWTFNRQGKLTVHVLRQRTSAGTITETDIVKGTFRRERTAPPSWRRRLGFKRAWTVFSDDQFVGAATSYRRNLITREHRYATVSQSLIKTSRAGATIVEKDTLLQSSTDANTECLRQQSIFGNSTNRITFTARRQQFKYSVGETFTLSYSRFNLTGDAIILGIRENTRTQQTTFRVLLVDTEQAHYISCHANILPLTVSATALNAATVTGGIAASIPALESASTTTDAIDFDALASSNISNNNFNALINARRIAIQSYTHAYTQLRRFYH